MKITVIESARDLTEYIRTSKLSKSKNIEVTNLISVVIFPFIDPGAYEIEI